MKLAWLCYEHDYEYDDREGGDYYPTKVIILFSQPYESWKYAKVVPIVYSEINK